MNPRRKIAGFSLLELLVVVFIIGILATMFTLSVGLTGGDQEVEKEVARLQALLKLANEEALMQGREIGMRFYADGYEFAIYEEDFIDYRDPVESDDPDADEDIDQSEWKIVGSQELLGPRRMPPEIVLELEIDGREVVLKQEDDSANDDDDEDTKKSYRPQIRIFSSGDFSPFILRVRRTFDNNGTTLEVSADGSIETTVEES